MKRVTVIIPNYNGLKFLDPCMSALGKQTYRDFCVIVVDNGSTDGSVEKLKELEKTGIRSDAGTIPVKAVYLPENTGFSGAVNEGLRQTDSEFVILLNNDTEADPCYMEKMMDVMAADPHGRVAAVSPLMLSLRDPSVIDSAGDGYAVCGWAYQRGVGRPADRPEFARPSAIFSACAGAALYRKSALDKIAQGEGAEKWWFDPEFFAYLEDVDVSWRLLLSGYRSRYEPSAKVLHAGSATSGSRYNDFKVRLAARNNVYVTVKNIPLLKLLTHLPFLFFGTAVKQLFFIVNGFGASYCKGFFEGVIKIPRIWQHRSRFSFRRLPNFVRAEILMIRDTVLYARDLFCRKVLKR